jgi:predicted porin
MKGAFCIAAVAATCASPMMAQAQSSVTLYGIIDTGIAYTNSVASSITSQGASRWSMQTGWGSGDRVGFTGREDLGGGLAAVFTLEMGFSAVNGTSSQGGRLFGRQAFVGLDSNKYGRFTMGRQYDFTFDYIAPMLSWLQFGSIYGAHVGDVDDTFQTVRLSNTVKYEVRPLQGLKVGAIYAFSNQAGGADGQGFANNRAFGFGATYKRGGLHAAASFLQMDQPSAGQPGGSNPNGANGGEYTFSTAIFYNAGFVERQRVAALGAGYDFDHLSVNAVITDARLNYRGDHAMRVDNYEVNTRYKFTPALSAGIGYIFTDASGYTGTGATSFANGSSPRWHQIDAGVIYLLSKRTDVHASVVFQRQAGDAEVTAINFFGPAGVNQKNQIAILAGLRHRF